MLGLTKYKQLAASEFLKPGRDNRAINLVRKIKEKEPFDLVSGKQVVLTDKNNVSSTFAAAIAARDNRTLNTLEFKGADGRSYKIRDLAKTPEFGGKGAGSGTAQEDYALANIREQIHTEMLKRGVRSLTIKIGKRTAEVSDARSTPGTPKSDFEFIGPDGNTSFWISHKHGRRATDFQQYGGMIELDPTATKYPEIHDFVRDVKKIVGDTMPEKLRLARPIHDKQIMLLSLFGKDYKPGPATGVNNIDVLFQGIMSLVKRGNRYEIVCAHSMLRGEIPTGDYAPYFFVSMRRDRGQYGINSSRFMISSKAGIGKSAQVI